jgi:rare lipoprotein A
MGPPLRTLPVILLAAALALPGCTSLKPPAPADAGKPVFSQTGTASWYGRAHQGRLTANGDRFDMTKLTAAHRTLELGTIARVTNLETGAKIRVLINDRGPYVHGRVIDLSAKAARRLGIAEAGTARVRIEVFEKDQELEAADLD